MTVCATDPAQEQVAQPVIGTREILQMLPHRYPFLLVDNILQIDLEKNTIVGEKNVTFNELFFQGHFPGAPIMPGVLVLEALAQTGGVLAYKKGYQDKIAVLLSVNNAKFRHPVYPGSTLRLNVEALVFTGKGGRVRGLAEVNGKLVVQAEIGYAFVDIGHI